MTDPAGAERLRACGPWGQALLRQRFSLATVAPLPAGRRLGGREAGRRQAPAAPGPAHRLPRAMALGALPFRAVVARAVPTGATRPHCPGAPGAGAVADRGYAPCPGRRAALPPGAALRGRLPPFRGG